jgi:hypothetical protein
MKTTCGFLEFPDKGKQHNKGSMQTTILKKSGVTLKNWTWVLFIISNESMTVINFNTLCQLGILHFFEKG